MAPAACDEAACSVVGSLSRIVRTDRLWMAGAGCRWSRRLLCQAGWSCQLRSLPGMPDAGPKRGQPGSRTGALRLRLELARDERGLERPDVRRRDRTHREVGTTEAVKRRRTPFHSAWVFAGSLYSAWYRSNRMERGGLSGICVLMSLEQAFEDRALLRI